MTLPETIVKADFVAAQYYGNARAAMFAYMQDSRLRSARTACEYQDLAADYAADAMFNRLLLIHDDVDAAEAAFDYVG